MATSSTADALLDAAEAHFAERGIEEASLRAIMRAADADPGAVHYHFRTRAALVEAVLDRVLGPLNARRLELLAQAEQAAQPDAPIALDLLLDALIRPDIETACGLEARSTGRARLIGAIYVRPADFVKSHVEECFRPVALRYLPHLSAAVPHVTNEQLSWRVRWCVFGMLGALLSEHDPSFAQHPDAMVAELTTVMAAAMAAYQRD